MTSARMGALAASSKVKVSASVPRERRGGGASSRKPRMVSEKKAILFSAFVFDSFPVANFRTSGLRQRNNAKIMQTSVSEWRILPRE